MAAADAAAAGRWSLEGLVARALEPVLRRWLVAFSREQLRLQGLSCELFNLELNAAVRRARGGGGASRRWARRVCCVLRRRRSSLCVVRKRDAAPGAALRGAARRGARRGAAVRGARAGQLRRGAWRVAQTAQRPRRVLLFSDVRVCTRPPSPAPAAPRAAQELQTALGLPQGLLVRHARVDSLRVQARPAPRLLSLSFRSAAHTAFRFCF
jgi:hypothetical protein